MTTLSQELKRLFRVPEVARIMDTSEQRIYELIRAGMLPAVRLGRQVRVDKEALDLFIKNGGMAYPGGWKKDA